MRGKATTEKMGDLVELVQTLECAHPSYPPVAVQDGLPVAESRIVAVPPPILTLRAYGYGLPADRLEPVASSPALSGAPVCSQFFLGVRRAHADRPRAHPEDLVRRGAAKDSLLIARKPPAWVLNSE